MRSEPHINLRSSRFNNTVFAKMAPRPTHFLCLPIVPQSHAFLAHLSNLKHDLRTVSTSDSATTGLPPAAVRPVGTLHFTLGVMNLDDSNRARAIDVMRGLVGGSEGKGLSVTLKGLRSIGRENGASVLYMAPENNGQVYVYDVYPVFHRR